MPVSRSTVREQFDDAEQQHATDVLGMWIFLATEILFFGGLFLVYAVYRYNYLPTFVEASNHLSLWLAAANTAVLITSSLTMAMAVEFIHGGRVKLLRAALAATALLGIVFLAVKGYEYHEEYSKQLIPFINDTFAYPGQHAEYARIFFNLYFTMTGLHALHLTIGIGLVAVMIALSFRARDKHRLHRQVEITGLYWHFVDIVWVLLFPLLYLIR